MHAVLHRVGGRLVGRAQPVGQQGQRREREAGVGDQGGGLFDRHRQFRIGRAMVAGGRDGRIARELHARDQAG